MLYLCVCIDAAIERENKLATLDPSNCSSMWQQTLFLKTWMYKTRTKVKGKLFPLFVKFC